MALADERVAETLEIGVKNFQTARIVGAEGVIAVNDMERRSLLRTRLGDEQCALRELERRESDLPNGFRTARSPAKPASDHQMKNEKAIILKRERRSACQGGEARQPASPSWRRSAHRKSGGRMGSRTAPPRAVRLRSGNEDARCKA